MPSTRTAFPPGREGPGSLCARALAGAQTATISTDLKVCTRAHSAYGNPS